MALALASAIVTWTAPGVGAAPVYTFDVHPGSTCAQGTGPAGQGLKVFLKTGAGVTLDSLILMADFGGQWSACFDRAIRPGMKLTAKHGALQRTITVPSLSVRVDRVADVISGVGPADSTLDVAISECNPAGCAAPTHRPETVGANGRYSLVVGDIDLIGGDEVEIRLDKPSGDVFRAFAEAPSLTVSLANKVFAGCMPKGGLTFTLKTAGGTLRSTASKQNDVECGGLNLKFKHNGSPVTIAVGDVIRGSFSTDARLVWPDWSLAATAGGSTVSGQCFADSPFWGFISRNSSSTIFSGTTAPDGTFSKPVGWTFASGDGVTVDCQTKRGDEGRFIRIVP